MSNDQRTKMGTAARLPKSIRKHVRMAKARIWAQYEDPDTRVKKLNEVFSTLGYPDPEKAKKNRQKAAKRKPKKGRGKAEAKG